eukprot:1145304-Pelagomonas_calceolata.AAC.1
MNPSSTSRVPSCWTAQILDGFQGLRHCDSFVTAMKQGKEKKKKTTEEERTLTNLQKWAQVTQEKMASPLDYNAHYHHYWSSNPRDALFGAHYNSLSS